MSHSCNYFAHRLNSVVMFLRAGYPVDAPKTGYAPLLALAPIRDPRAEHRVP